MSGAGVLLELVLLEQVRRMTAVCVCVVCVCVELVELVLALQGSYKAGPQASHTPQPQPPTSHGLDQSYSGL